MISLPFDLQGTLSLTNYAQAQNLHHVIDMELQKGTTLKETRDMLPLHLFQEPTW